MTYSASFYLTSRFFNNKSLLSFVALLFCINIYSQVGINTDMPADIAILDIESTDKGVLIPRINIADLSTAAPITGTMINGLLVYNTNVTTGEGFYYWSGTAWTPFVDADFLEVSTSNPPSSVASPVYRTGNVNIGTTTNYGTPLYVESVTATNTPESAAHIQRTTSHTGTTNRLNGISIYGNNSNSGEYRGVFVYNQGSGTGKIVGNVTYTTSTSTGEVLGTVNEVFTTGDSEDYGTLNTMGGTGNGTIIGTSNVIESIATGTGNKFGTLNYIDPNAGGAHFATWSQATKANSYAGMFIGRLAIAQDELLTNQYTFPNSSGVQGQVLQLQDNAGTLGWSDAPGNESINEVGAANYVLTAADHTVIAYNTVTQFTIPDAALNANKTYVLMCAYNNGTITLNSLGGIIWNPLTNTVQNTLPTGQRIKIHSTGTYWAIVGN
ncbi:MAG: hypothetical protein AB8B65_08730 [Kordia sp.]|uniref:hypothetical protein n=1 Tax=Kordia sp. TaxID=1965332 RepID=UPI00385F419D